MSERPTVLLVDDQAVVRAGIRMLLESQADVTVVAEASSAEDAIAVVLDHDPDVIVTDLSMEGSRGASVVEAFVDRFPSARILVLSMVDSPADVRRALEAGAKGYMLKGAAAAALRCDLADPQWAVLRAARARHAPRRTRREGRHVRGPAAALTEREREVLSLLAIGHTNPELATLLYLSPRTVESHRANIQRRLGVRSRADLVRAAAEIEESESRTRKEDGSSHARRP